MGVDTTPGVVTSGGGTTTPYEPVIAGLPGWIAARLRRRRAAIVYTFPETGCDALGRRVVDCISLPEENGEIAIVDLLDSRMFLRAGDARAVLEEARAAVIDDELDLAGAPIRAGQGRMSAAGTSIHAKQGRMSAAAPGRGKARGTVATASRWDDRGFAAYGERTAPAPGRRPVLSVLVIARNAARTVEKTIRSVLALDGPEVDLIVVDDGSTDATAAIARPYAERGDLRLLRKTASEGPALALTDGALLARSKSLLALRADGRPQRGAEALLGAHFVLPQIAAVVPRGAG